MLHRLSFIGPATGGLGVGAVEGASNPSADGYSVVGCPDAEPRSLAEVVVVPAPGQRRVRTTARDERPPVEAIPSFYDTERGYPISVTFGKLPLRATKLRLLDAKGNAIAGECFTPERPIHSSRPSNGATAFFIARAPLASDAEYTVEFAAEHAGAPLVWRWTFRTQ
jgi:hypothetical protein